jgi:hypothetical protein
MAEPSLIASVTAWGRGLMRRIVASALPELVDLVQLSAKNLGETRKLMDLELYHRTKDLQAAHPNPLNRCGRKCFSQADEDGITLEILRRLGIRDGGTYAEFGVGDGTENNTLILAALGWRGFWVSGGELAFTPVANERFLYIREWLTLENILESTRVGLRHLSMVIPDIVSMDLDGNDIYFAEKLLDSGFRPQVFIVEYNGKFPPPVEFQIAYDPAHVWAQDDYFGASLSSFAKLFAKYHYRLVCCNAHTGSNAFFVDAKHSEHFADIPTEIETLYVEPRYFLYNNYGHRRSPKVIERVVANGA